MIHLDYVAQVFHPLPYLPFLGFWTAHILHVFAHVFKDAQFSLDAFKVAVGCVERQYLLASLRLQNVTHLDGKQAILLVAAKLVTKSVRLAFEEISEHLGAVGAVEEGEYVITDWCC